VHLATNGAPYRIDSFLLESVDRIGEAIPLAINKILVFVLAIA
jgi:hypothetical protein